MEYTTLGSTGTAVSRICLGCVSFGSGSKWMLGREESTALIERAIDLGVNFFDTANVYSHGESEEILGNSLEGYDRERMVIATKVHGRMHDGPNSEGLSRKAIEQELTHSLKRLDVDFVDIYQIHRWDYNTSIEETLRALDDAVRRGHVRYIGASSMWAHQFAGALATSDRLNVGRFATMQNHYNLVYREEEREMLPLCERENVGVIPYSPLAKGYLARPHGAFETTTRATTGTHADEYRMGGGPEINRRVEELAAERGLSMAQVALAWQLHKDWVGAPIVGTTSVEHLEAAVEAVDVSLSDSDIEYLEEPYVPVPVSGHE